MRKILLLTICLMAFVLNGCGSSDVPGTSEALNYNYLKTESHSANDKTSMVRYIQIQPDPLTKDAITQKALAQTVIKAAFTLYEEEPSDITQIYAEIDESQIGRGEVLAKAVYIPGKKDAGGSDVPMWQVNTVGKDIPREVWEKLPQTGLVGGMVFKKTYEVE
ncbi:hypothetical protein [Maridesulfovibrio ferrireducens]|uniref:DUF4875 domain-containing protein n=1 Tax=Maridesulfovibrio ferrireducens TaxID=246191 RepID=UPI001A1E956D|nr:hypothetical protein [Maridesulfovibrio ferrireducens]MBI9112231.1 hypothetical protein [Maridesulfovibrio ferrireducens]